VIDEYLRQGAAASGDRPLARFYSPKRESLQLAAKGKSTAEITRILPLSPKTVATYCSRVMEKLGLKDLPALIKFAIQHGVTQAE